MCGTLGKREKMCVYKRVGLFMGRKWGKKSRGEFRNIRNGLSKAVEEVSLNNEGENSRSVRKRGRRMILLSGECNRKKKACGERNQLYACEGRRTVEEGRGGNDLTRGGGVVVESGDGGEMGQIPDRESCWEGRSRTES